MKFRSALSRWALARLWPWAAMLESPSILADGDMTHCSACGNEVEGRFCESCGHAAEHAADSQEPRSAMDVAGAKAPRGRNQALVYPPSEGYVIPSKGVPVPSM